MDILITHDMKHLYRMIRDINIIKQFYQHVKVINLMEINMTKIDIIFDTTVQYKDIDKNLKPNRKRYIKIN